MDRCRTPATEPGRPDSSDSSLFSPSEANNALPLRSHPLDDLMAPDEDAMCRVCWGEHSEDDPLVSPCRCAGTQRYIHAKCLDSWMKVKVERGDDGVDKHPMCELCGEEFTLGTLDIRRDVGVIAWIKYKLVTFRNRIMNSRIGRGLRWFDNLMWLYSTVFAGCRTIAQLPTLPKLIMTCRKDPRALKPMATNLVSSLLMELSLSTYDYRFYLESVAFYALGWTMDACARTVMREHVAGLPPSLQGVVGGFLIVPQAVGLTIQAVDLSFIFLLGGISSSYLDGMLQVLCMPLQLVGELTSYAAVKLKAVRLGWLAKFSSVR